MSEDPLDNFKKGLNDVLSYLMCMSRDVVKKADIYRKEVDSLNLESVDNVINNINKLFERININLSQFSKTFDITISDFKKAQENQNSQSTIILSQESNHNLRLNGDTLKTDIDLTQDDDFNEPSCPNVSQTLANSNLDESIKKNQISIEEHHLKEESEDSCSDNEPTLQNFEVPISNDPENEVQKDEIVQTLHGLAKITDNASEDPNKFTMESFSFDDSDDDLLLAKLKEVEKGEEFRDEAQRENHELLELLTKAVDDSKDAETAITEEDGDQALAMLEEEISTSSLSDSDESMLTEESGEEWRPPTPRSSSNSKESESDGFESDVESEAESENETEESQKVLSVELKKVDNLNDSEIDKLCDMHSLNKRKCKSTLKRSKRKKMKRVRVLSTSSSSSDEEEDSSGTVTPDIPIDTEELPQIPLTPNEDPPDGVAALADELADKLDKEDEEEDTSDDSSESEDAAETPKKKKRKVEKEVDKEKGTEDELETVETEEESERFDKIRGSWRDDPLLNGCIDSDSSTSTEFEIFTTEEKAEVKTEEKKEVLNFNTVPMIISDSSNSSSDDDVTFVDQTTSDEVSGKGRRQIRAILSDDELSEMTQRAKNEEDERILRLEEHSKTIETIQSQHEDFVLDVDVNSGKPLITVDRNLAKMLKPHQKSGVQFMWEACYESTERLKKSPGTGCILAHCMGLGKTRQVITLIHTLFAHSDLTKTKHVLIICPISTVINWKNEFRTSIKELAQPPKNMPLFLIIKDDIFDRIDHVKRWHGRGGVLIMGYDAFQIMTNDKISSRVTAKDKSDVLKALIDPGPDLIVCDEGHQLKNGKTLKTQAVMKIRTKRRIVLTGTPLQNNLKEYYFMVQFVKPHLLGTYAEYSNRFVQPIMNGQYQNSLPQDIRMMKKRTHVLTKMLNKTIHRVEGSVLSSYLPEITDYTLLIKLTPLQEQLYKRYVDMVTAHTDNFNGVFFHDTRMTNFCNLHPYTLHLYYSKPRPKKKKKKPLGDQIIIDEDLEESNDHVRDDWYKDLVPPDFDRNINYSAKLKIVLDIINETVHSGEKALVFAQHLIELDLLEHFLKLQQWRSKVDYFRMDGETSVDTRDELCRNFNTNPTAKVFLLTHRVGGLGLNLTGANRVILIGSNYNPSHDTQSMYRVYRFGQKKNCYIYRLLSLGTMEEKIYHRCVVKLSLSGTVVDKYHFDRHYKHSDLQEMYKYDFDKYNDRPIPVVPTDKLMATLLKNTEEIYSYHLHNALLQNKPEEELTDEDKKLAWEEFNRLEETAKQPPAPVVVIQPPRNPFNIEIFPANLTFPFNRFGQYSGSRNTAQNMVPNPMNSSARGFIPRGFMPNGTPQNMARHTSLPQMVDQPSTLGYHQRRNYEILPHFNSRANNNDDNNSNNGVVPASREVLRNQNLMRINSFMKALQARREANPAPSTGEFNYALNKVV